MTNDPRHDAYEQVAPSPPLSARGAARRDEMLDELTLAMGVVRRARRRRRAIGGAAVLLLAAVAAVYLARGGAGPAPDPPRAPRVVEGAGDTPPIAPTVTASRVVSTDPSVLDRYAALPASRRIVMIDDNALLAELSAIGRPAGIIRTGDEVRLSANVVDQEPAEGGPSL